MSAPKSKKNAPGFWKRNGFLVFSIALAILCWGIDAETTERGMSLTVNGVVEMIGFLPPIFILLGLFDVWVERETVVRLMGTESGLKGAFLAFMLGSLAAGPLYMAFPVAVVLLKKKAGLFQIFVFIGTWAIAKVPMLLFETSCFGLSYTSIRFVCNVSAILLIAWIMCRILGPAYTAKLYEDAEKY